MCIHQMDVVTTYIQGDLSEEIYMEQLENFKIPNEKNQVCLLKQPL